MHGRRQQDCRIDLASHDNAICFPRCARPPPGSTHQPRCAAQSLPCPATALGVSAPPWSRPQLLVCPRLSPAGAAFLFLWLLQQEIVQGWVPIRRTQSEADRPGRRYLWRRLYLLAPFRIAAPQIHVMAPTSTGSYHQPDSGVPLCAPGASELRHSFFSLEI